MACLYDESLEQRLLLQDEISLQNESSGMYTGDGSVDYKGKPVLKNNTGKWRACIFILGTECFERLAFYGIAMNLVTYLTQNMHEGNASAARNVSIWGGTCLLTPLLGAFLADAYWGRYWTIAVFSTIYFLGMCTMTLAATIPSLKPSACVGSLCPPATTIQSTIFFSGLYLISLGSGGIKPCVSSFGADQFDDTDPIERVKRQSFFNWFYFSINIGAFVASTLIVWIQDNIGWGVGFIIPALCMAIAVISFFSGTSMYRFQLPGESPFTRVGQVIVASIRKWKLVVPTDSNLLYESPDISAVEGGRKLGHTDYLRFFDKASIVLDHDDKVKDLPDPWRLCTVTQVEELKILIRMFPIWATAIIFSSVSAQIGTTFLEQGLVMDPKVGSFTIPAASLSSFNVISVILCVPLYDQAIVPIFRKFTGNERGFSLLQRMGIGLFISIFSMIAAALVEIKRLEIARISLNLDENIYVPLSILWQIPQYSLIGCAEVFIYIGLLEFFYDQSPDAMRSLCSAFALLTSSLGSYLNSFMITIVSSIGWLPDDLNKGHLDYYFWFLGGLSFLNLVVYVSCAKKYKEKRAFR